MLVTFASVAATAAEKRARRPGDELVEPADVVMATARGPRRRCR